MPRTFRQIRSIRGKPLPKELLIPIAVTSNALNRDEKSGSVLGQEGLFAERQRRLRMLGEHIGAVFSDGGDNQRFFEYLALSIAVEFVPGFQIERPRKRPGRQTEWNSVRYAALLQDVNQIKSENPRCTDVAACKKLLAKGLYQDKATVTSPQSLANRLSEAIFDPVARELAFGRRQGG
jgi:hypothetical protein